MGVERFSGKLLHHLSRRFSTAMASCPMEEYFSPPEAVRGCKTLDRDAFQREFQVPAIRLAQAKLCSIFLKKLSHACLKFSCIKNVLNESTEDGKVSLHPQSVQWNCYVIRNSFYSHAHTRREVMVVWNLHMDLSRHPIPIEPRSQTLSIWTEKRAWYTLSAHVQDFSIAIKSMISEHG